MNNVVLYSGGVDSFLVHHWLNKENIEHGLLYFDLDGRYSVNEVELFESYYFKKCIKQNVVVSDCLHMGSLEQEDAFIPNRNLLATIMAHSVTSYDNIWIGGTLSDRVNDNNKDVFDTLSDLLSKMYGKRITITSPFWNDHKATLIKSFVDSNGWNQYDNKIDSQRALIHCTFSCYYPIPEKQLVKTTIENSGFDSYFIDLLTNECMNCPACFRKCMSLFNAGIYIPMSKKSVSIIDKYYNEAKDYLATSNDLFGDSVMKDRMEATISYCDYWRNHV